MHLHAQWPFTYSLLKEDKLKCWKRIEDSNYYSIPEMRKRINQMRRRINHTTHQPQESWSPTNHTQGSVCDHRGLFDHLGAFDKLLTL